MGVLIKERINKEFNNFVKKEILKPEKCKNLEQIRFYVNGLAQMIKGFQHKYDFVPDTAYGILDRFNKAQNRIIFKDYKNGYFQYNGNIEFY